MWRICSLFSGQFPAVRKCARKKSSNIYNISLCERSSLGRNRNTLGLPSRKMLNTRIILIYKAVIVRILHWWRDNPKLLDFRIAPFSFVYICILQTARGFSFFPDQINYLLTKPPWDGNVFTFHEKNKTIGNELELKDE